ncbi:FapA family protein [Sporosarcina thermotolerans]|uniref:FapA family protein n=1 Tax=Sporosarcina thermotolerans TaxID=633404 RepID=A0AAW9AAK0_9BACL|nr:FapA family protein [Sporosarcina thermotolerans]MDW0117229.1 FapA family protein [Sporosarcina thermotolerans]WHT47401.1 FapA family protein [Sporosarcina thermotolerans]
MHFVITKGNNIDEAIQSGLAKLNSTKNNVHIEVIQHRKNKLFISEKAVVRLTMKEKKGDSNNPDFLNDLLSLQEFPPKFNEKPVDTKEGKAWIKDGKIYCKPVEGKQTKLTIPQNFTLLINGKKATNRTVVLSDDDDYVLESEIIVRETQWKASLSTDMLEARITVKPGYRLTYKVIDSEPAQHLVPMVVETKEIQNTLEISDIIQEMELLGVNIGLNHDEMEKATQTTESQPKIFVIANGSPAKNGENGWLKTLVKTKIEKVLKVNEDGRVNFREIKSIPVVEIDDVLAIIHPPTNGEEGFTVRNEPIPCDKTFPIVTHLGNGVAIEGDKIIATKCGRPLIEQTGQLVRAAIIRKLTHQGNVDLSSGNIRFKGDVEVVGEVTDNMVVEAFGDILIHKAINNAIITTTGSVITNSNCNSSTITAAENDFFEEDIINQVTNIISTTEQIKALLSIVMNSSEFKNNLHGNNIQAITHSIIQSKFEYFPNQILELSALITDREDTLLNGEWLKICLSLERCFLSLIVVPDYLETLEELLSDMKQSIEESMKSISEESFIKIPKAMNCNIFCNGDVFVTDHGCINTNIQSGGHVQINNKFRGGKIVAEKGISVGVAGSLNSSLTLLSVSEDQTIRIRRAMEGVVLKIGKFSYQFTETAFNVKAFMDKNGELVVEFQKGLFK